jgi:protein SCO1/2
MIRNFPRPHSLREWERTNADGASDGVVGVRNGIGKLKPRSASILVGVVSLLALPAHVIAHGSEGEMSDAAVGSHAEHPAEFRSSGRNYTGTRELYEVPPVTLISQDGEEVALAAAIDEGKDVMMNFIFTSCTTICPVLSASFDEVDQRMESRGQEIDLISISIDPEYDTRERLAAYAERVGADESWRFFTGERDTILLLQKAFDTYRGNKMNHVPLTFIKRAGVREWARLEGFPSVEELLLEYQNLQEQ